MATAQSQLQDRLALVSSLYGPGTITCWYLTTLSVLVSWTLHPRKRQSGSIDVDLIAVLTLPAVAAAHLVSQVRGLLNQKESLRASSSSADGRYSQSVAAIEAPFNVSETFMAISVVLFIVATWTSCIRRAIFVALVGLLCYAVECYVHFSGFMKLGLGYSPDVSAESRFSRFFLADFANLIIATLVILSLICSFSAAFSLLILFSTRIFSSSSQWDIEGSNGASSRRGMPARFVAPAAGITRSTGMTHGTRLPQKSIDFEIKSITTTCTLFLSATFICSLMPITWPSINYHTSATTSLWQRLDHFAIHLGRNFLPRTAYSITDLDQVVAAVAGATVLGFSIYSVAKARYKIWNARRRTPPEPTGAELNRIENHSAR